MLGETAKYPLWFAQTKFIQTWIRGAKSSKRSVKLVCFTTVGKPITLRHPALLRRSAEVLGMMKITTCSVTTIYFHDRSMGVPISRGYRSQQKRKSKVLAWYANSPTLSPGECMWTIWTLATGSGGLSPHGLFAFGIGHLESPGAQIFPSAPLMVAFCAPFKYCKPVLSSCSLWNFGMFWVA